MGQNLNMPGRDVANIGNHQGECISLTNVAKYQGPDAAADIVKNGLRARVSFAVPLTGYKHAAPASESAMGSKSKVKDSLACASCLYCIFVNPNENIL